MDFIPARKVALLLRDHGIPLVVSNACQSANARTAGPDANLARVFIEEGVSSVVAMQADVMSGSATSFSANFYRGFLQRGLSFSEAVQAAREELRRDGIRSARFGLEVTLEDWVVPVTYLRDADARIVPPEMTPSEDSKVPASTPHSFFSSFAGFTKTPPTASIDLIGRGRDTLNIEKDLIESKILIVTGQAGVGKTALLRHLAGVWRATKFAERVIYVDFAQPPFPVTVSDVIERAKSDGEPMTSFAGRVSDSLWGWWTQDKTVAAEEAAQFVEDCHEHSSVLIFDSLDLALSALPPRVRSGSLNDDQRAELSALVDRLVNSTLKQGQKKPMVILVGRAGGQYWDNRFETISSRIFKLMPLDLPSAVSLGSGILQQAGVKTSSWNVKETEILYRLVNLLSRNPLALEVVLPHAVTEKSLADFYETIHFHFLDSRDIWRYKPSAPGADRILYDIDIFFMRASYQMRNVLRSFSLFWIEGPALLVCLTVLTKVFSLEATEEQFWDVLESHLLLYAALGAWDLEAAAKDIVEIHPLFSIYLRSKLFGYLPFEKKLDFPTLITNFRLMLDESHKSLLLQFVEGALDFALLCNIHKRSLANIVTCLKCCLANRTSEEWPKLTVHAFIDSSRFAFRDSVPDHLFFLRYLEPALRYYVLQFGGPLKCLGLENLPFALKMSNHLTTMYLLDADFLLDKAVRQARYSLELINVSEEKHPPLSVPQDMFEKQMAFRLKATISLSQRNFAEAEKYWDLQTELEKFILGPNGYPSTAAEGMATIKRQFGDTAAVADAMSVITSNVDKLSTTFLPALAEFRQKAWSEVVKSMKSAGPDEDLRHSMRPYVQQFTDQISGATGGIMSRVVDVSKDVGYDVGHLQEEHDPQSWQSDLDDALDQGDSARMWRIQHKLLTEDLQLGNFASARIHVEMLQQHLETSPNPPKRLVYWMSLSKTMLEAVKDMSDAERSQVAHGIRMFTADEGFTSIFKDIARDMESRAGITSIDGTSGI
jgi:energy-coupling factor transporter ATP-binding protein EcfA2